MRAKTQANPRNSRPALLTLAAGLLLTMAAGIVRADPPKPNTDPFPEPGSKKGLQVQMVDDAIALGIRHATLNVSLGALFHSTGSNTAATPPTPLPPGTLRHECGGHTNFLNAAYVAGLDRQIKPMADAGIVVYLILLAYPSKDAQKDAQLLHPNRRPDGKFTIAAFNTAAEDGLRLYRALIGFLAERYSGAHPEHGRVWGYIVGNEVNSHWLWYNLGTASLETVAGEYEKAVRATHFTVRRHSAHARTYLSLDHHWNASMPGISAQEACKGRDLLDTVARIVRERGDFEWHLAYHPYPDDLGNPRTWLDKAALPHDDSPHVTFKNLEVACAHLARPELLWQGAPRRIILSEQGIHCLATPEGEALQAAGFAYAWEKVARQPGIDALIWHRHVDHAHEGGLRLGLWENQPGSIATPGRPRAIHGLFARAGTQDWENAARPYLPTTGLKSWGDLDPRPGGSSSTPPVPATSQD